MSISFEKEQRVAEASALRELFREQWFRLLRRVVRHQRASRREQREAAGLGSAVERIVEGTDSRLRVVGGYQKRLRRSARVLLDHLDDTLATLSRVIEIDRPAFATDPLVGSLMTSHAQMQSLLSRSTLLHDCMKSADGLEASHLYAVVMLARKEKTVFGSALQGNLIVRDVKQTSVQFHSHRIVAVAGSEAQIRSALKRVVFEGVIGYVRGQMTKLRHSGSAEAVNGVGDPWSYLQALERLLGLPQELIWAQNSLLHIDNMGIVLPPDAATEANLISLDELTIGDNPSQIVCIARIPRCEIPEPSRLELPAFL
jgi:hypothetical protein